MLTSFQTRRFAALIFFLPAAAASFGQTRVVSTAEFAPASGLITTDERPFRDELCLNGSWQFQPIQIPAGFVRDTGTPPSLTDPQDTGWVATPIKIPSPWNVNTWGNGRKVGVSTEHPFWPGSVYFPSYPAEWDGVEMGWLRRSFRVPKAWQGRRLILHFEAVAGDCRVFVNGRLAGTHFDKYLPFELDVTDFLRPDGENELRVGVRATSLFDLQSTRYPKMRCPYPCGSSTDRLAGIWQDVFLVAKPLVHVEDNFVEPLVDQKMLQLNVEVRNDSDKAETIHVDGVVSPWINEAGNEVLSAPVPKSRLGPPVLSIAGADTTIAAHRTGRVTLRRPVIDELRNWAPGSPNLYSAVVSVAVNGQPIDRYATRFGWRQFTISGRDFLLNGQKLRLTGDLLHPFGPFVLSRRYAWAWYKMIQDMGGNSVRLHAQIHPGHYLELADEMGLVVLDETAIFGSAVSLNFEPELAWQRFADHYDGLVLRDRNHPCVLGWSVGNELFAGFNLNHVSTEDADRWYTKLGELARRATALDPTRQWISCDGDEDLRGQLPVYSKHFGLGLPVDRLPPTVEKPMMVGESGGTYYARPAELSVFNGDKSFDSYASRNDALGIDVYDNLVHLAASKLAYYSASETAWFGLEHLNFGYHDFTRLPTAADGVFFTAPFEEGKPGIQPERLPPYVATLNPGWDAALPLYKPLAMFKAEQAALDNRGPQPCEWDHRDMPSPQESASPPKFDRPDFIGDPKGILARSLLDLGVRFTDAAVGDAAQPLMIVDADTLLKVPGAAEVLRSRLAAKVGTTLVVANDPTVNLSQLLPAELHLTDRSATALRIDSVSEFTKSLSLPTLYFAEQPAAEKYILRHGMAGPLVDQSRILLSASSTDWSLFNNVPEVAKCGAEVLYEHLKKEPGSALIQYDLKPGNLAVCTLEYHLTSPAATSLWRTVLQNMGVRLAITRDLVPPALEEDSLAAALVIGRFEAADLTTALSTDYLGAAADAPIRNQIVGPHAWSESKFVNHDRFLLNQVDEKGTPGACAIYLSYWIKSPRALDELLAGGPDVPRFNATVYVAEKCRMFLNGRELIPGRTEPADYRTLESFENLPLVRGWNHFLFKVVSSGPSKEPPPTLSVRVSSNDADSLRQLESALQRPPTTPSEK